MRQFKLLVLLVGVFCYVEANAVHGDRFKRGPPSCPPPKPMMDGYTAFIADAKSKGVEVPAILEPRENMPCPPNDEMKAAYKPFIEAAKAKSVTIPDFLDPSKMPPQ